ncbi:MAG TPA: polysaccharide deacetylase family protein, partial [Patescibacteria group bacterium]
SIPLPISVTYAKSYPNSTLENLRNQAKQLSAYPVSIISGGQQFTLNIQEIKNLLTVVERPNPKNAKQLEMFLRIDDTLLNQKLDLFAAKVESLTHAEFNEHDARIAIYNQLYTGNYSTPVIPTGGSIVSKNVLGVQTSDGPKIAYLTFDDGPNTIYQPLILDILKQYGIKATFFFIGQNIPNAHDVAVRTYSEGHLVGNHTWSHPFLPNLSSSAISNELTKADNILMSINGNLPVVFFRPPYGGINNLVVTDAHSNNLRIFLWDVDPRDWSEPPVDELVRRVVNATINGSNVLMHSNHLVTVRALPRIIETLKQEGYSFKTLGDYPKAEEL